MNPFTISFGKTPDQYISRISQTNHIIDDFSSSSPSSFVYMITGVRGSGKTVFANTISKYFSNQAGWLVLELNPTTDLLYSFASKLYAHPQMHPLFLKAKLSFTLLNLSVSLESVPPAADLETMIEKMLRLCSQLDKRILLIIDEVSNTPQMRTFASSYQIFLRQDYPVQLLMTGLYENIYNLQNEDNLTFLYRAPKIILDPLNYSAVMAQYRDVLHVSNDEAAKMAGIVKGYSFGFQVLGYLYWERKPNRVDEILPEFDLFLNEYVYSKIWSELSAKDKQVLSAICNTSDLKVKNIRESLGMTSNQFTVYRDRLLRKGIIGSAEYGILELRLPRFKEFVQYRLLEDSY